MALIWITRNRQRQRRRFVPHMPSLRETHGSWKSAENRHSHHHCLTSLCLALRGNWYVLQSYRNGICKWPIVKSCSDYILVSDILHANKNRVIDTVLRYPQRNSVWYCRQSSTMPRVVGSMLLPMVVTLPLQVVVAQMWVSSSWRLMQCIRSGGHMHSLLSGKTIAKHSQRVRSRSDRMFKQAM